MGILSGSGGGYLLAGGIILLLAVLLMEHRLSRISRKLDRTNTYLERLSQGLASQTRLLEAISETLSMNRANAAWRPEWDRPAASASKTADSAPPNAERDNAARAPRAPGPTEL